MKQADFGLDLSTKKTRKRAFLAEMEQVVPWPALVALIEPYYGQGKTGRPPIAGDAAGALHAAVVRPERPGDGGGVA